MVAPLNMKTQKALSSVSVLVSAMMWMLKIPFVSMSHAQSLSKHVIYVVVWLQLV